MPYATFIIPAWNAAATLGETLESLVAQTEEDWEAVVVDDGSADATGEVADRYARSDPRIKVRRYSQNRGISAARNFAMREAKTPFLAFIDADDIARPDRLQMQLAYLEANPQIDAVGSAVRFFGATEKTIIPETDPLRIAMRLIFTCEFFMTSVTMRRASQQARELWFRDGEGTGEDWEFFGELVMRGGNLANTAARHMLYRRSASQATANLVDRPDSRSAKFRYSMLVWLGVPEQKIDIDAHIAVSPCHWPLTREVAPEAMTAKRIDAWLGCLAAANQAQRRFPQPMFLRFLDEIRSLYADRTEPLVCNR